jgi:pimeloyl-ACP methyl ester carboxylesterase
LVATPTLQHLILQGEPVAVKVYQSNNFKADAILVHGFTGSKEDFDFIAPLLADRGYRVTTFDNRGQHQSAHSQRPDAYSTASISRDIIELATIMKMEKPHLFGHSLGGVIAQVAAADAPDTFASLTLMCSGPKPGPHIGDLQFILENFSDHTMESAWEKFHNEGFANHPRKELMKSRWLASDMRSVLTHAEILATFPSRTKEIAATGIAAHVIYGDGDDRWPLEMQDQMAKELFAPVSVIKDAGHCPNEDQPAATAKVIADFWDLH